MLNKFLYLCCFTSLFLFTSCGYKASSTLINNVFDETIYVEVEVDGAEPENAPFLKDEMNRMVYTRFKGRVVSKEEAKSQIRLRYKGSSFTPLAYENGYVTRYRANIKVHFDMVTKEGKVSKDIRSVVDADIQASSLTSSAIRTEAIRRGLEKALDEFLAYVSAKGMLTEERND